jgi:hypothetical protein
METVGPKRVSKRELTYWASGLAALCIAAVALVGWWPTRAPATVVLSVAAPKDQSATVRPSLKVASSPPVHLVIPSLGISTKVGLLGLQPDGEVMVPDNVTTVGWFRYGPTPGQIGSSVILGHVDSFRGPGVFFDLKTLHAGDEITVALADGVKVKFAVTKVVEYSKVDFPDRLVYGSHGTRSLNLVTCGGAFDHATGHYESNIVVFSRLVRVIRSTA